ncbi:MAG: pentapeptide repeat-containing protein [Phormidesmis sp.]
MTAEELLQCYAAGERDFEGIEIARDRDIKGGSYTSTDLSGVNLSGANFRNAALNYINLERVNLEGANLSQAGLYKTSLVRANLRAANLEKSSVECTNFSYANLVAASLRKASGKGAYFGANLTQSDLRKADLTQSRFDGAVLRRANLTEALLNEVTLFRVDLREAIGASLDSSKYFATILPNGTIVSTLSDGSIASIPNFGPLFS